MMLLVIVTVLSVESDPREGANQIAQVSPLAIPPFIMLSEMVTVLSDTSPLKYMPAESLFVIPPFIVLSEIVTSADTESI